MNKYKKRRIVALLSAVLIIVLAVILIKVGNSVASTDTSILRRQVVDNLSFENATIDYNDGVTTFTVDVYNDSNEDYTVENIDINFVQEDGQKISLLGYTGGKINKKDGKKITASVDIDLRATTDIEYVVNK